MDLGYVNARVRGWRARLLKAGDYNRLLYGEGLEPILEVLKKRGYGRDLEVGKARYGDETVKLLDYALKENLSTTLSLLWEEFPQEGRSLLLPLYAVWEVSNIKAILRGIDRGIGADEIWGGLLPVGRLDGHALRELCYRKGVDEVIHLLFMWGSPYWRPLKRAYPQYERSRSISVLEFELDRSLYPGLSEGLPSGNGDVEVVKGLIQDRVDMANLMTILKYVMEGPSAFPLSQAFIEGGKRLGPKEFQELSRAKDVETLLHGLRTRLHDHRWLALVERGVLEDLALIEEGLEGLLLRDLGRLGTIRPLSIAIPLHFAMAKWREVKALRLVVRAKVFDIPSHEVERYLKWTGSLS